MKTTSVKGLLQYNKDISKFNKALAKAMKVKIDKNPKLSDGVKIWGKFTKAEAKYIDKISKKLEDNNIPTLDKKYNKEKERLAKIPVVKTPRPKGFKKVKYDKKSSEALITKTKDIFKVELRQFAAGDRWFGTTKATPIKTADIDTINKIHQHVIKNTLE
jgi:hypothetical protein